MDSNISTKLNKSQIKLTCSFLLNGTFHCNPKLAEFTILGSILWLGLGKLAQLQPILPSDQVWEVLTGSLIAQHPHLYIHP